MENKNTPLVSDELIAYYRLGAALNITKRDDEAIMDAAEGGANAVRDLYEAHLQQMRESMQAQALKDRWIPVEEQLPPDSETVWLANAHHNIVFLGSLVDDGEVWCWAKSNGITYVENGRIIAECEADDYDVTHWRPLPEAPSN